MANEGKNSESSGLITPDNMGRMNDPDGSAFIKGICGDSMEMYLVIKDNTVIDSKFHTDGYNSSRFCGSMAAKLAKGRSPKEVLRISPADILDSWGEIPEGNAHCAILAVSTLHKALADYLIRTQNYS
jgi:nitrogen fixation protein NifU and related proteins